MRMVRENILHPNFTFYLRMKNYLDTDSQVGIFGLGLPESTPFAQVTYQTSTQGDLKDFLSSTQVALINYQVKVTYVGLGFTLISGNAGDTLAEITAALNLATGRIFHFNNVSSTLYNFQSQTPVGLPIVIALKFIDPTSTFPSVDLFPNSSQSLIMSAGFVSIRSAIGYNELKMSQLGEPASVLALGVYSQSQLQLSEDINYFRTDSSGNESDKVTTITLDPYQINGKSIQYKEVEWMLNSRAVLQYVVRGGGEPVWLYFTYVSLSNLELFKEGIQQEKMFDILRLKEVIRDAAYMQELILDNE